MATSLQDLLASVRANLKRKDERKYKFHQSAEQYEQDWCEVYEHSAWVYRIWVAECACGCRSHGLEGVYEERRHPRLGHLIQRRVEQPFTPEEVRIDVHTSAVQNCLECCGLEAADIEEAINAETEEPDAEGQVAPRGATGDGREGEALAA